MKRIDPGLIDPAVEPTGEKVGRVVRSIASALPVVGGAATEIFTSLFEGPLSKRRTEWMVHVSACINELIDSGLLTEKDLQENEAFVSIVAQTCNIALKNHEADKLEALKSAIKNTASPENSAGDYGPFFLSFVDSCTSAHIQLLHVFDDPERWFIARGMEFPITESKGRMYSIGVLAFPEFEKEYEFYENVWGDLCRRGFAFNNGLSDSLDRDAILTRLTTPLGSRLIRFLT